jgi:transposase-like protein
VARRLGVNASTLWRWQRRYGGARVDEAQRLLMLEKENARVKRVVAELELNRSMLKEALEGKY